MMIFSTKYSLFSQVNCGAFVKKTFNPAQTLKEQYGSKQADVNIFSTTGIILASQLPQTTFINKKVKIWTTFVVDVPILFNNCELEIGYIDLNIIFGGEMRVLNSKMYAANKQWKGINVKYNGFLSIARSRIEDAITAVRIDADAKPVNLLSNIFNRNRVGIANGDAAFSPMAIKFGTFADNIFTCSSNLEKFESSDPDWSVAGILLNFCNATISSATGKPNYFFRLEYGIKANASSFAVTNCFFHDNYPGQTPNSLKPGYAVYTEGGSATITTGYTNTGLLKNCQFGTTPSSGAYVRTSGSSCNINEACFEGGLNFVENIDNASGQMLLFYDNNFRLSGYSSLAGIFSERPAGSGNLIRYNAGTNQVEINANSGVLNEDISLGIHLYSNYPSSDKANIGSNFVNINGSGEDVIGIDVVGIASYHLLIGNLIKSFSNTFNGFRVGIGIGGLSGKENYLNNNLVNGQSNINNFSDAYLANESPYVNWCLNDAKYAKNGFHFAGNCNYTNFKSNTNKYHKVGLLIDNTNSQGVIGTQTRYSNLWSGSPNVDYTDWAGFCDPATNPTFSRFITEATNIDIKPTKINIPGNGWFDHIDGNVNGCNNAFQDNDNEYDNRLLTNNTNGWNAYELWYSRKSMMKRLIEDPTGTANSVLKTNFYDAYANTNIGKLALLEANWETQTANESVNSTGIGLAINNINRLLEEIVNLEDQSVTDTINFTLDPVFEANRTIKLDSIRYYRLQEESYRAALYSSRSGFYNTAQSVLSVMVPGNQFETNAKNYMRAILYKRMGNTLTQTQLYILEDIASQCPTTGGEYVNKAAQMLGAKKAMYYMANDATRCNMQALVAKSDELIGSNAMVEAYPNPNNGQFTLSSDQDAKYFITDLQGRPVMEGMINAKQKEELELNTKPDGFYILKLSFGDGSSKIVKLMKF